MPLAVEKKRRPAASVNRLKPCRAVWEVRHGKKFRVYQMTNAHLLNALLYVERSLYRLEVWFAHPHPIDPFDITDDLEFGQNPLQYRTTVWNSYSQLYNEARRRGLVVVPITGWFGWDYDSPLPPELF